MTDIIKIQKAIRKSVKEYFIESKHEEEDLVALLSVDIYLSLESEEAPVKTKRIPPASLPVINHEEA